VGDKNIPVKSTMWRQKSIQQNPQMRGFNPCRHWHYHRKWRRKI